MSLFKYYHPDSVDFILVEGGISIRFSQPELLNDPFETNIALNHFFLDSGDQPLPIFPPLKTNNDLFNFDISFDDSKKNFEKSINNSIGIFSMSKDGDSRPLWSYYSKDHSGFIIEFEDYETVMKESFGFHTTGNDVIYEEERPKSKNNFTLLDLHNSALYKDRQWKHENEFRVIAELSHLPPYKTDPNGYSIHIKTLNSSSVKRIILGVRANQTLKRKVLFWAKNFAQHVTVETLALNSIFYSFDHKSLLEGHTTDTRTP